MRHSLMTQKNIRGAFRSAEFYVRDLLFFFLLFGKHEVGQYAEDQSAGDLRDRDLAEADCKTAYTGYEYDGYDEQIPVVLKVYLLDHLKTGYGYESVQSHTYAAHHAARYGVDECYERGQEGDEYRAYRGEYYRYNGGVSCYGYAGYGFTVRGVRAAAEERACHGSDTVAEKRSVKTGIFKQVFFYDGRNILVVRQVFREYNERNGNVCRDYRYDIRAVQLAESAERGKERELGKRYERFYRYLAFSQKSGKR